MNQRPSLREALARADIAELDETADTIGRVAGRAIATALEEAEAHPPAVVDRYKPTEEEERQRLNDAALGDVVEMVARHRMRLGRRVCSGNDAKVIRLAHELLRGMADATGGVDSDPSFQ